MKIFRSLSGTLIALTSIGQIWAMQALHRPLTLDLPIDKAYALLLASLWLHSERSNKCVPGSVV